MRTAKAQMSVRSLVFWSGYSLVVYIHYKFPLIQQAGNEGPDKPAQKRRLIRACVVRKLYEDPFRKLCIILCYISDQCWLAGELEFTLE